MAGQPDAYATARLAIEVCDRNGLIVVADAIRDAMRSGTTSSEILGDLGLVADRHMNLESTPVELREVLGRLLSEVDLLLGRSPPRSRSPAADTMFVPLDSWIARDAWGRQVSLLGRTGISVVEGGREYFVDSEFSATPGRISVFVDEAFEVDGERKVRLDATETVRVCRLAIEGARALGQSVDVLPKDNALTGNK